MTDQNFTTTITVDQSPEDAFAAINNVRGWWSEAIAGDTDKVGAVFDYHFQDLHRCKLQITELVPGQRVAWLVLDNHFSFTQDKREWTGTTIVFDIARTGNKTEIRFTHIGLVPEYECFDACSDGWSTYIGASLHSLIATGTGQPNVGEAITGSEQVLAGAGQNYTTTFAVEQTPEEVFAAINNVRAWWTGELEGSTDKLGDEFTYRYETAHRSTQRVTELVPGRKVVWHVVDAELNFVRDKAEWTGTDIAFEIARNGDKTDIRFTHIGLVPDHECFDDCSNAWGYYINGSLRNLIATGRTS